MDIGFDSHDWLARSPSHRFEGGCSGAPEWLELRARLGAAWSARRELGSYDGSPTIRCGSFHPNWACALAKFEQPSPAVNRIALGNLKPLEGNTDQHTGEMTPGGRG
jgi:hypothetical protein